MPAATMSKGQQAAVAGVEGNGNSDNAPKRTRRGNPLMNSLSSDFLSDPRPLEFADGMPSDEFAMEKCVRFVVEPLKFETEKEWLAFAKRVWTWAQQAEERHKAAAADELIARLGDDPELIGILKKKLAAL